MDEVQLDPVELDRELPERIQPRLVHPPVVARAPVLDELLHVGDAGPVAPGGVRHFIGPPHPLESGAEIGEHVVSDFDRERAWSHAAVTSAPYPDWSRSSRAISCSPPLATETPTAGRRERSGESGVMRACPLPASRRPATPAR